MLVDQTHYLRLLKHNYGGVMLVQTGDVKEEKCLEIESIEIDVPLDNLEKERIDILEEFKETVTDEALSFLPPKRDIDHRILLLEDKAIHRSQYRLSYEEKIELNNKSQN